MDTNSAKILHSENLDWNRLNLSRTCRQIFAETAAKHFEKKLLPLSIQMVGTCDHHECLEEFTNRTPFSQGHYIKEIVLDHRPIIGDPYRFSFGAEWSLLSGLSNLNIVNISTETRLPNVIKNIVQKDRGFEIRYAKKKAGALLL